MWPPSFCFCPPAWVSTKRATFAENKAKIMPRNGKLFELIRFQNIFVFMVLHKNLTFLRFKNRFSLSYEMPLCQRWNEWDVERNLDVYLGPVSCLLRFHCNFSATVKSWSKHMAPATVTQLHAKDDHKITSMAPVQFCVTTSRGKLQTYSNTKCCNFVETARTQIYC